jgi:nucleoside-triphosphatase
MILLSGRPGVGKTTLVSKVVYMLRRDGYTVGGVCSREIRSHGLRIGFEMVNLADDSTEELAGQGTSGPRLGRYKVNLKGLGEFAAPAIIQALRTSDVVVCDEVGPMELLSPEFRRALEGLLTSEKPCLVVLHSRMADPLLEKFKKAEDGEQMEVTEQNREILPQEVYVRLVWRLKGFER